MDTSQSPLSPETIHDPGPEKFVWLKDWPNVRYMQYPHAPEYNLTWQDGRPITLNNAKENPKAVSKAIKQYYIKTGCLPPEFPQGYVLPADSPDLPATVPKDISSFPALSWDRPLKKWSIVKPNARKTSVNGAHVREKVYDDAIRDGSFNKIATFWKKDSKPRLPLAEWYINAKDHRHVLESALLPDLDLAERSEDVNNSQAPLNKLGLHSTLRLLSISPATKVGRDLWSMRSMDPVGFLAVSLNDAWVEAGIPAQCHFSICDQREYSVLYVSERTWQYEEKKKWQSSTVRTRQDLCSLRGTPVDPETPTLRILLVPSTTQPGTMSSSSEEIMLRFLYRDDVTKKSSLAFLPSLKNCQAEGLETLILSFSTEMKIVSCWGDLVGVNPSRLYDITSKSAVSAQRERKHTLVLLDAHSVERITKADAQGYLHVSEKKLLPKQRPYGAKVRRVPDIASGGPPQVQNDVSGVYDKVDYLASALYYSLKNLGAHPNKPYQQLKRPIWGESLREEFAQKEQARSQGNGRNKSPCPNCRKVKQACTGGSNPEEACQRCVKKGLTADKCWAQPDSTVGPPKRPSSKEDHDQDSDDSEPPRSRRDGNSSAASKASSSLARNPAVTSRKRQAPRDDTTSPAPARKKPKPSSSTGNNGGSTTRKRTAVQAITDEPSVSPPKKPKVTHDDSHSSPGDDAVETSAGERPQGSDSQANVPGLDMHVVKTDEQHYKDKPIFPSILSPRNSAKQAKQGSQESRAAPTADTKLLKNRKITDYISKAQPPVPYQAPHQPSVAPWTVISSKVNNRMSDKYTKQKGVLVYTVKESTVAKSVEMRYDKIPKEHRPEVIAWHKANTNVELPARSEKLYGGRAEKEEDDNEDDNDETVGFVKEELSRKVSN